MKQNNSLIMALLANVGVCVSKGIGFAFTGSSSLLNETIHSGVDCLNQILLLHGKKSASSISNKTYNFGRSRENYFWSMVVAGFLFFGGGIVGLYEATEKIISHHYDVELPYVTLTIILVGIILESISFKTALKEINELNETKLPILDFLKTCKNSEIIIIFTEDACALIGLLIALLGQILSIITGNGIFDPIAGMSIGLLLMIASIYLTLRFKSLIIGETIDSDSLNTIYQVLNKPEINKIISIKTLHNGPDDILIALKLDITYSNKEEFINKIEEEIRENLKKYKEIDIFVELDKFIENYK